MISVLQRIFSPRTLTKVSTLKNFLNLRTERIPPLDKFFIYFLYRFSFFKNKFLNNNKEDFSRAPLKAKMSDFPLGKETLDLVKSGGISPTFKLKPETVNRILERLNNHNSILIENKAV